MARLFQSIQVDVPLYHFSAIRGSLVSNWQVPMVKGHIGCLLSHMLIWSIIAKKKDNHFYLILEDDLILESDIIPGQFMQDLHKMVQEIPKSIRFVHCSRDMNKMFIKNKTISKYNPKYKILGMFQNKQIKKCSLLNPWSTETGAILMRPKGARKLLSYVKWALIHHKRLPFNPHVDLVLSYWPTIHFQGAMVKIFQQNTGSDSDLKMINKESVIDKTSIIYNETLFNHAAKRLTPWLTEL